MVFLEYAESKTGTISAFRFFETVEKPKISEVRDEGEQSLGLGLSFLQTGNSIHALPHQCRRDHIRSRE